MLKSICVYCGSSSGARPEYSDAANELGKSLAENKIRLIYGGANCGIMGILADAVLNSGGQVTGVMPEFLVAKEVAHKNLTESIQVRTMHERKTIMAGLADAFVAMPGGWGTMEEFFEALTWAQLGLHPKPCALLNVCGYFDHLIQFFKNSVEEQFLSKENLSNLIIAENINRLLHKLNNYEPNPTEKWLANKLQ